MKKLLNLVPMFLVLLTVLGSPTHAQYKGKYVGWSTGYVYGAGTIPAGVYKAFTHLMNFHVTVDGSGGLGTGDLRQSNQKDFVAKCHANGVKALLSIGGEGEHANFVAACANASTQTTLVKNIIDMTVSNGYDGVDLDWEVAEDPAYDGNKANVAKFLAFHKEVWDAVKTHPGLMITAAITDDWYPNCSAAVCSMMDQANGMSYDISAANEYKDAAIVFKLGAPKANHGIGFDMNNLADNLAKCRLAIDSGFGGVMAWDVTKGNQAAFDSIARYVTHVPVNLRASERMGNDARLFVKGNGAGGMTLVSYSLPSALRGTPVELGMYGMDGALVKSLFHGKGNSGAFLLPVDKAHPGAYVLKLSANSSVQTAKTIVLK